MNTNKAVHAMARVRELATRHAAEELEHCLAQAIAQGDNACISDGAIEERINALARAGFVKQQVEQGATLTNALRELGRRMRALQVSPLPQESKLPPPQGDHFAGSKMGRTKCARRVAGRDALQQGWGGGI